MKSNLKFQPTNGQVSLVLKTLRVLMERHLAHLLEHNNSSVVAVDLVVVASVEVVATVVVALVVAAAMVVKEVDLVAIEGDLVVLEVVMVVRKVAMVMAVDTAAAEVAEEEEVGGMTTVGKLPNETSGFL